MSLFVHIKDAHFRLHYGDLTDSSNLTRIMQDVQPDEVYTRWVEEKWRYEKWFVKCVGLTPHISYRVDG